jgi:hypothetical protein
MSPLSLCCKEVPRPRTRVHSSRFDNYSSIFDQLLHVRARVGVANFCLFSGVKPDFAFADPSDARCEALLGS